MFLLNSLSKCSYGAVFLELISKKIDSLRVLLIDHQDSFSYNIVQLLENCGAKVELMDYNSNIIRQASDFKKIILSPGPGLPTDYPYTLDLIQNYKASKEIFGICLGLQAIAVAFGGKLFRQSEVKHGAVGRVTSFQNIFKHSMNNLPPMFKVGLYHSWAVDEESDISDFIITAKSDQNIIMGLKHKKFCIEGVQFHPESFITEDGKIMMSSWLNRI